MKIWWGKNENCQEKLNESAEWYMGKLSIINQAVF